MLKLVGSINELDFLPPDAYAARITALAETYGTEYDFAMFWIQTTQNGLTAAVSKLDGDMTVCCKDNADFEELSAFINAVGFFSLTCDEKVMKKLGVEPQRTAYTVRFVGCDFDDEYKTVRDCDKRKLYGLLCDCGFELGNYNAFLADVCARLGKGTASLAAIMHEEELCACAFALFKGKKSVLLGAVATNTQARGKGYASHLVVTLASENSEKEVFLFCRNDSLADFYAKNGFEICGRWAVAQRIFKG